MTASPSLSVIVSTYERPAALDAVLAALADQPGPSFEIVVADDGSGPDTTAVVSAWRSRLGGRVKHAWQEDRGYRRARLLNLAVLESGGAYLLFLDGDCVPRPSFVAAVRRSLLPGVFVAGKRVDLSQRASRQLLAGGALWRRSTLRLLLSRAVPLRRVGSLLTGRDRRRAWRSRGPEFAAPYAAYGFLTGVFRTDFQAVNGLDTRYVGWGHEDVDLAIRLRRKGLTCGWPGPRSTLLHLPHPSGASSEGANTALLEETRASKRVEAVVGLRELAAERSQGAG